MKPVHPEEDSIDLLCHHCGKTFSAFLHQMADQNAKVVCPHCQQCHDHARSTSGSRGAVAQKKTP